MGAWIMMKDTLFDLEDPQPDMVQIEDIAIALGKLCRFSGHCNGFYSVAELSVRVAFGELLDPNETVAWVEQYGLEGLLHDAAEAYIGDLTTPLKSMLPEIGPIERRIDAVIREKFGLPTKMSAAVAAADVRALAGERMQLFTDYMDPEWPQLAGFDWDSAVVHRSKPMIWQRATFRFLATFRDLTSGHTMAPEIGWAR